MLPRLLALPFRHLGDSQRPFGIGAVLAVSLVLKAGVGYAASVLFAWLSNTVGHELRVRCFEQLLYLHFDYLERSTWGRVINTIASDTWRTADALGLLCGLIRGACVVLVFGALLVALSWQLTLIVVFALSVIGMIAIAITRKSERLGRAALISNNRFADRMYDAIGGLKIIRSFGTERPESEAFAVASERVARDFLRVNMISNLGGPVFEVLSGFVLIGLLVVVVVENPGSLATTTVFVLLLFRMQPNVRQVIGDLAALRASRSFVENVFSFVDDSDKPYPLNGSEPFSGLRREIVFDSVRLTYAEPGATPILAGVSFSLPRGYQTRLGERGTRLSGGQRQRIALARAILRDPDILILDEATNALDAITEQTITQALHDFSTRKTLLVVAHRLSTIENATNVVVLDNGRIVQCGPPSELAAQPGLFAEYHRLQRAAQFTETAS